MAELLPRGVRGAEVVLQKTLRGVAVVVVHQVPPSHQQEVVVEVGLQVQNGQEVEEEAVPQAHRSFLQVEGEVEVEVPQARQLEAAAEVEEQSERGVGVETLQVDRNPSWVR